ncbi:MAG TPA: hypothetical protein VN664_04655 [Burkholderiales bacterium]|nr:hypothetical protein [Burkholderiales bacterium]
MPWHKAMLVWLLIIVTESVQGVLRNLFLAPAIGDFAARQVGALVGAAVIVLVAWLMAPWLNLQGRAQFAGVGLLWVVLTVVFELSLGRALGLSWERMASDYDITRGGLLGPGLIVLAFAPYAAARLRASEEIGKRK